MTTSIREAFEAIGADVLTRLAGDAFEIDVQRSGDREVYQLTYPLSDSIQADVLDVRPRLRHLVLDVSGWRLPISGRYLCGHDEQHWFVASLPFGRRSTTVAAPWRRSKPEIVLREQQRKGVRHRRNRRKTAAYVSPGRVVLPAATDDARRRVGQPQWSAGSSRQQAAPRPVAVPSGRPRRDVCARSRFAP